MSTIKLKGSSSGEAEVTVAAAAGTPTFTLPTTVGSANQLVKNSGTAGTLEYSNNLTFDGTTLKITDTELAEASDNFSINIQSGNNDFYVKSGGTTIAAFKGLNKHLEISDGDLVIGTSGHGIDFSANSNGPGTSVSELFHTYEEGYWVPTWNSNLTLESSYQNFQYTRVGRLVTVRGYVYPSSWSGSTAIYLTLPFASLNDADAANAGAGGCMFKYLDGCTGGLASYVGDNASAMYFYRCESGNSNYSALTTGNLQSGALWYFSHTYAAA